MAYRCSICEKGPVSGFSYSHSHRATKRVFRPNLQKQKLVLAGKTRTAYVCSTCIKSGKAVRPSRKP
ncbi:MAG: 50S ribosomal protein L28 [Elusimicrobiota bacterium]|jgi:large subunit ribosomal protein L28